MQISDAVANAMLDAWEANIGPDPILKLRAGAPPANLAAPAQGTVIATLQLPTDWMQAAAARSKAKNGNWQDPAADNLGIIAHYEILKADGVTRAEQGTVSATGGGGDMTVDNTNVAQGQPITITGFTRTFPANA